MNSRRFQGYLSALTGAFGVLTAAAGLTQLNTKLAVATLAVSVLFAAASAVFFFRAHNNSALENIAGYADPEYRTTPAREADLRRVAEIDQDTYGSDSVDYTGLHNWWRRYRKGVTLLLEDDVIIGAIGIWPLTKDAYVRITSGSIDESGLDRLSILEEADPTPRAYWYFSDIILLEKYQNTMKNLSGRLLMDAVGDWVEQGNLADELHLCAVAIRPRETWLTKTPVLRHVVAAFRRLIGRPDKKLGKGEKTLRRFGFEEQGLSPSGQPIFARTLSKRKLLKDVDRRIRRRVEASRVRAEKRAEAGALPAAASPARRWQWAMAVTAAAALLITVIVVRQLPGRENTGATGLWLDRPQELRKQTAAILKIGLRDHTHCTLDSWDESPADEERMTREMGKEYAPLVGVVRESLSGSYEVVAAHRCAASEREFVHLILRKSNALVSVAITRKGDDEFPQQGPAAERVVSGVALYRENIKTFEVAGFVAQDYLVFVVSNLDRDENLGLASKLALSVQKYLLRLEA